MKLVFKKPDPNLWLAIIGSATIVIGAAYVLIQQSTRLGANDVPLTMSQVITHELDSNAVPADAVAKDKSNLKDNIPFAIITDASGGLLASSASLDGKQVLPPSGTFKYTKTHGSDTFTWQPASGVRLATHMTSYGGKNISRYIITGQSLTDPQKRIDKFGLLAVSAWVVSLIWTTLALSLNFKHRHHTK